MRETKMKRSRFILSLLLCAALAANMRAQTPNTDSLDAYVRGLMARRQISGVSLAIIQGGRIVFAKGYGVVDDSSRAPVTTATLFQAGSISKPVSALGALHLVEAGRLSLDGNVNDKLTSWKAPENAFTKTEKVTLRRILSHNAGLTVHGFPGYDVAEPKPTLVQVLDGAPPANTPAIRVDTTPGAIWSYSGGGFTVMQQMVVDVTGKTFPQFMQQTVLGPIGMTSSSFDQPLPPARMTLTASGYYADRKPVRGRWHVYPEMAAAGLWTTPTDLARFAIEVQETLAGRGHGVISPAMARQFITVQKAPSGLGIFVQDSGGNIGFSHGGRDEGFDAVLVAFATTGQGAAIMMDANDNSPFFDRVLHYIGRMYGWPTKAPASPPAASHAAPVDSSKLAACGGWYEFRENQMVALAPNTTRTGLEALIDGLPDEAFLAIDSVRFGSTERAVSISFVRNAAGAVTGAGWLEEGAQAERSVARVAPLPSTRTPVADPDTVLTTRTIAAIRVLDQGGSALASAPDIPPGTKRDFSGGTGGALAGLTQPIYLGEEDVSGRGIHRHGSEVARVRYYRVTTTTGLHYLLAHLTAQGNVADFDLVDQ
jgi:CubicO group peptidase (beta-lactamase class C family)